MLDYYNIPCKECSFYDLSGYLLQMAWYWAIGALRFCLMAAFNALRSSTEVDLDLFPFHGAASMTNGNPLGRFINADCGKGV